MSGIELVTTASAQAARCCAASWQVTEGASAASKTRYMAAGASARQQQQQHGWLPWANAAVEARRYKTNRAAGIALCTQLLKAGGQQEAATDSLAAINRSRVSLQGKGGHYSPLDFCYHP